MQLSIPTRAAKFDLTCSAICCRIFATTGRSAVSFYFIQPDTSRSTRIPETRTRLVPLASIPRGNASVVVVSASQPLDTVASVNCQDELRPRAGQEAAAWHHHNHDRRQISISIMSLGGNVEAAFLRTQ